jgi:ABC-2 type transport system permease protein
MHANPIANYVWQVAAALRTALADRTNFVLLAGGMIVNNGFFLAMWLLFFAGFRSVGGWGRSDVALLLGMMMVIVGVSGAAFGGYRDMAATILRGEVDALLTQPRSVLARLLSREAIPSAVGDLATGLFVLIGFADLSWGQVPMLLVGLTAGLAIYVAIAVCFACMAFWARGARSLARDLVDFVILVSSYPGSIFTGLDRLVIYSLLPAGFIVLTPVRLLRAPDLATFAILAAATAGYVGLALGLFSQGLRRYRRGFSPVSGG